jgi:hypothetical protein
LLNTNAFNEKSLARQLIVFLDEKFNVKETYLRTSGPLATEGRHFFVVNPAAGMNPNFVKALIQRGGH